MLTLVSPEKRVPERHPLRSIEPFVEEALVEEALKEMSPTFDRMYSSIGRSSIPPVIHYSAATLPQLDFSFHVQNTGTGSLEMPAYIPYLWSEQPVDSNGQPTTNGVTPFNADFGQDVLCNGVPQNASPTDKAWLGPGCTDTVSVKGLIIHDFNLENAGVVRLRICANTFGTGL